MFLSLSKSSCVENKQALTINELRSAHTHRSVAHTFLNLSFDELSS